MSSIANKKRSKRIRRKLKKVNTERFRLTVFKSSKNISAQIIDDVNNKTLVSASSNKKNTTPKKKESWFVSFCCWYINQESSREKNYKSIFW